ncbi:transmembrane protein 150A [Gadus morhua]|uniref:Si:dkey-228d14.5 n=1 Tax=Gadus morhua TaxID=8049 RepID=A0A8C4Z6Y6_GADMO|nr:transmembrane protein 150A-like [Gadus morhua]
MIFWIILPISLSLVSLIGTWSVYAIAVYNNHVCSLGDWGAAKYCNKNDSTECCLVPTISSSGTSLPENSLFSAIISGGAFLFLVFSIFHHAHIMEKNAKQALLSRIALVFGIVAATGAFAAGNCNPGNLPLLHHLGAALSFTCICFYTVLLTSLTGRCLLTGYEKYLYPLRIISSAIQISVTIGYSILFAQPDYRAIHISAVFEWMLSVNLELFELSYVVEFAYFYSWMLSNLLIKRDEQKPLILAMS